MIDKEPKQRERAYKIWEDGGRPDGAHDEHWKRAEVKDGASSEEEDVTKANLEADDQFNENAEQGTTPADVRPPSTVAPD